MEDESPIVARMGSAKSMTSARSRSKSGGQDEPMEVPLKRIELMQFIGWPVGFDRKLAEVQVGNATGGGSINGTHSSVSSAVRKVDSALGKRLAIFSRALGLLPRSGSQRLSASWAWSMP